MNPTIMCFFSYNFLPLHYKLEEILLGGNTISSDVLEKTQYY